MDNNRFFISLLILLLCASCGGKETLFREDQNTPNGWRLDQPAVFTIQENLTVPVDLYIHLRNDQAYPFSNIFLVAGMGKKIIASFISDTTGPSRKGYIISSTKRIVGYIS